ncbi:hypothetical protein GCM10010168_08920 [Actinoplanes ianthinogenes]|uniref:Uncharacterized protein n=1 Tax=Actinoplanes ianthinogenes TaxID=122358 RepID=A0ABN6CHR4_9ACTN|nr:hypothetical protein [Actinoplanes ianthinogenes]BCJ44079.1 hypothetical protein Aiant_47360 [Actinoplanes ianthinogenes]GGQ95636.1 hypothetical protein GCM10010168_08920 [Actinoplanes ianthinogenes]
MRVISRRSGDDVQVFDEALEPLRIFPLPPDVWSWSVSSARDSLVYATDDAVVRIDPDGRERWRFELGPQGEWAGSFMIDAVFSADDTLVWVYAPQSEAGRGDLDEWIVLDAATGEPRRRFPLETAGQGGGQHALRDGRMLLDVGEGQDGGRVFLAGPDGEPHDFGWYDRVPISVAPDESQFMTVEHGQDDVAFHDLPGGEVRFRLTAEDFGADSVEFAGGYLDDETAIVVVAGGDDSWRHFRVGTRTGEVLGDLGIVTMEPDDLEPLGDGTYVITDTDGTLRRM